MLHQHPTLFLGDEIAVIEERWLHPPLQECRRRRQQQLQQLRHHLVDGELPAVDLKPFAKKPTLEDCERLWILEWLPFVVGSDLGPQRPPLVPPLGPRPPTHGGPVELHKRMI